MKIALIGYGKMGRAIEEIAEQKGHEVVYRIDVDSRDILDKGIAGQVDVAIEFSTPQTAYANIMKCFDSRVSVVCGTTGWLDKLDEVRRRCQEEKQAFLYASNFSVGVNIFFQLNTYLARLMDSQEQYEVSMEEIHHKQKKDSPSGTAITLAEQIIDSLSRKTSWVNEFSSDPESINIVSKRINPAAGTHIVRYTSEVDDIEIRHTAHSRKGFASGAVTAAEWILGKEGFFTMKDVLGF